jgi:tape measure domain-containing protein
MATARKDVELVIRARDQAAKALDAIAKAASNLVENVDEIGKSGAGVDSALGRLGTAINTLDKAFKGLSTDASLTKQFDAASEAAARLERNMESTAEEGRRLASELDRASQSAVQLAQRTAQAAVEVKKQEGELKKAQAAQTGLNATLRESIAARDKLVTAEARLTDAIGKQPARIQVAQERYDRLAAAMQETAEPTATLQKRFEASATSLAKAQARLATLTTELEANKVAVSTANAGIQTLEQALADAAGNVSRTKAELSQLKGEYKDLGAAAKQASNEQKTLAQAQADIAEALNRQQSELEQSKGALGELTAEQNQARTAMAALAQEARGPLLQAFSQQQRSLSLINNAFQDNRKEIAALGAEMGRVGVPTREMVESYNRLLTTSNSIRSEYAQQRAALALMREGLRAGVTDIDQLRAMYQRFSTTVQNSSAALTGIQQMVSRTNAANTQAAESARRAADAVEREGRATQQTASGKGRAAAETDKFSAALRRLYGDSRQAMSITQRLRGEVLSLIAAYGGLYGVINVLGQVVTAYQALEAATSRLNVVNEGDQVKTAQDLDFVRRTAARLGIEFAALAQEYSKFSVATAGTNLEGENTRKIFVAVAEAARVNKVSTQEMAGTFVALTQIVSKGAVQMEELRQQLGDRLPGALQIMADGLGVSTAELIKMMEQGQVSSEALIGFAEELNRRFGGQLEDSLKTTSAEMGKLQNQTTQALLAFGEAGFMQSFTELLRTLTETMQGSDFQTFIARVSQGLAGLVDVVSLAISNWQLLAAAMTAVLGIRLLPVFVGLVAGLRDMIYTARGAAQAAQIVAAQATATGVATTVAATGVGRLALAFRALMSATGVGLLLTAAATAFTIWSTSADAATTAMEQHKTVIDKVRNAYDKADKSNSEWARRIEGLTTTEIRVALEAATAAQNEAFNELYRQLLSNSNMFNVGDQLQNLVDRQASAQIGRLQQLVRAFEEGRIEVDAFKQGISTIAEGARTKLIQDMAEAILANATNAEEAAKRVQELEALQRVHNGTATEADEILLGLAEAAEAASDAFDPEKLENFTDAMREMAGFIPELKGQLATLKDLEDIEAAYQLAQANAQSPSDRIRAYNRREQAIQAVLSEQDAAVFKEIAANTGVTQDLFNRIYGEESYRGSAYDDGYGNPTIGYGSTTVGGKPVQMGDTITQEAAMKEAVAEIARLVAYIEGAVKVPLSKSQMEALVSYTYNAGPGSLARDGILAALNKGDYAGAATAIGNGPKTSNGVYSQGLADRRAREQEMFSSGINDPAIIEHLAQLEQERLQTAEDFREALRLTAEQEQQQIDLLKVGIIERETAKALAEAENAAKEAGTTLTQAEIEGIKTRTAALYAEQAAEEAKKQVQEERAAVEERVNALLAQRTELENQLAIYRDSGQTDEANATEQAIMAINEQLQAAIANAIAMHEAIGGVTADASIAKLQTLNLEAAKLDLNAQKNLIDWKQVGQMFATGLTQAISGFFQAVAAGEDATEAAKNAFLQFASQFLIKIGEMIIQQLILNALQMMFPGSGTILGGLFGTGHTGGIVGSQRIGSGNGTRMLSPAIFAAAPRYHEGGIVGLKPGEVPAVLKENEEVLTRDDPRHAYNGGMGGEAPAQSPINVKVVNAIDPGDFVSAGLDTVTGEKAILNFMRMNKTQIRGIIG